MMIVNLYIATFYHIISNLVRMLHIDTQGATDMAQMDAENFIREIVKNTELRTSLYQYDSSAEIMAAIKEKGYPFKLYMFEESINHLKTESPTEDQANMLDELFMWWQMLMFDGTIVEDIEETVQSCTPAKCASCSSCG